MRLIFVESYQPRKIFNVEIFPNYGTCERKVVYNGIYITISLLLYIIRGREGIFTIPTFNLASYGELFDD